MSKTMRALSVVTVCILALMMAPLGFAQIGSLPPPMNWTVINAYYPQLNPAVGNNCDVICAEGFSIDSPQGAYVSQVDMGLVGTNFIGGNGSGLPSSPITCPFTMSIWTRFSNGAVGFEIVPPRNESATIPANNPESTNLGQPVPIPFTDTFAPVYLGQGNYYLMMNNTNGCTGANSSYQGLLDWNLDSPSVASVGPQFAGMFKTDPTTWLNVNGTFTFDLIGPWFYQPPVGGGSLQIARLVVAGPITPAPGGPVEAQVGFVNAETGALLGPLTPITVQPGPIQLQSVNLNLTPFISRIGGRIEVQPVVVQTPGAANPGPTQLQATVQMLDAITGFGTLLAPMPPAGERDPGPTGAPGLSPQILAGGQTMRFDVAASPFDACSAQVSFNNGNGVALIPAVQVNLTPGTGTTVDLNADALGMRIGTRIEVQPVITPTAPLAAAPQNSVCVASVEVFDHLTGRTWSHQSTMVGLPAVQTPAAGTPGVPTSAAGTQ